MVKMGSPELPESGDLPANTYMHFNPSNINESDNFTNRNEYGYEPLRTENDIDIVYPSSSSDESDEELEDNITYNNTPNDSNVPNITSSDTEIMQQVWNAPREREEIELDTSKAEQIMTAMANITLPNTAIPDWAQIVPEEKWKQDLLDKIRQRKDVGPSNGTNESNSNL